MDVTYLDEGCHKSMLFIYYRIYDYRQGDGSLELDIDDKTMFQQSMDNCMAAAEILLQKSINKGF